MRHLEQGLILHPVVEVACFVVPNKEDRQHPSAHF